MTNSSNHSRRQFHKISIGVTLNSGANGKDNSCQEKMVQENRGSTNVATSETRQGNSVSSTVKKGSYFHKKGKLGDGENKEKFPWLSPKSFHHETQKLDGVAQKRNSLELEDVIKQKKNVIATVRDIPGKKLEGSNEILRQKLWEILGTIPSQDGQNQNGLNLEVNEKSLKVETNLNPMDKDVKSKQNSDTIESDSEEPARRPMTRSLTQKRPPLKLQQKSKIENRRKSMPASISDLHQQKQKTNVFNFDEEEGRVTSFLKPPLNSLPKINKKNESKRNILEPRRIYFPRKALSEKNITLNEEETEVLPPKKALSSNEAKETCFFHSLQNDRDHTNKICNNVNQSSETTMRKLQENCCSPLIKTVHPQECFQTPMIVKNVEWQFNSGSTTLSGNAVEQGDFDGGQKLQNESPVNFQSPTFAMDTPRCNGLISPEPPNSSPIEEALCNPEPPLRSVQERDCTPSSQTLSADSFESNTENEFLELEDSHIRESLPTVKDWLPHTMVSMNLQQSKGSGKRDENGDKENEDLKGMSSWTHQRKRLCVLHMTPSETNCISLLSKGIEESNESTPEISQENDLARAIAQFALILQNFEKKVMFQTNKKSYEILTSFSDQMQLQLKDIETKIQDDIKNLECLGKSKRKHFEILLQEQQDRMKSVCQMFKDDISQLTQDCKRGLEELEAFHIELKGHAERQKVSHRKLILKQEEDMETQLSDAERRIKSVRKTSKETMKRLKQALLECLREGTFG